MASLDMFNMNIGILGHVDSGKTSLGMLSSKNPCVVAAHSSNNGAVAKALSTTASTASFDKNPQSKARGITLDLGRQCHTYRYL
jgi:selenocysteine-specific elongation factor